MKAMIEGEGEDEPPQEPTPARSATRVWWWRRYTWSAGSRATECRGFVDEVERTK